MKKIIMATIFIIAFASFAFAETQTVKPPTYKTLVIEDIIFNGADIKDLTPDNKAEFDMVRPQLIADFKNSMTDYLASKKLFINISNKATGSSDEIIFQSRYIEIQLGSPGRRMARYFLFFIPIGGSFDLEVKGRLVDSATGKEITSRSHSTNTGWYNGDTGSTLLSYSKDLALQCAEDIEDFMINDFDPQSLKQTSW